MNFTENDKALIREIAREVAKEMYPMIIEQHANNCPGVRFINNFKTVMITLCALSAIFGGAGVGALMKFASML